MNPITRGWKPAAAVTAAVLVTLTGLAINSPAASATSVSGCQKSRSTNWSAPGLRARVVMSLGCTVKSGSRSYSNQDFVTFSLTDTKCDASGPRIFIHRGSLILWTKYNSSGCDKTITGSSWTNHQSATWYVSFNSDKMGMTDKVKIS